MSEIMAFDCVTFFMLLFIYQNVAQSRPKSQQKIKYSLTHWYTQQWMYNLNIQKVVQYQINKFDL